MSAFTDSSKKTNAGIPVDPEDDAFIYKVAKSKFTLNQYGKMSLSENPHLTLARTMMDKSKPVLEAGCAFGYTSKILLKDGFDVIANDLDQRHLDELAANVTEDEKKRLKLLRNNIVDLDFADESLSGIVCFNVIHFLNGQQIREIFNRFFRWLAPNGILVISAATPYFFIYGDKKQTNYDKLKRFYLNFRNKIDWPGDVERKEIFDHNDEAEKLWLKYGPNRINIMSAEILAREAVMAHFNIFKIEHFEETTDGFAESVSTDKIRVVSMICIKQEI
jgi:SAM-dependent methyltransferase